MKEYYDRRAAEYDATSYEALDPSGRADLERLAQAIAALAPGRVLDVACGTGYVTQMLHGDLVALDQSEAMLAIARGRVPAARFVRADVPPLPFEDATFDRVFTSSFYSHLADAPLRDAFVAESLRVAGELVVVEEAWRPAMPEQTWETRTLADGTSWLVFKRYFTAESLAAELAGEILLATRMFVMVRRRRS